MPPGIPTEQVLNMRTQGLSNNQIIQTLQRDGYRSDQVFEAMTQADMKSNVGEAMGAMPPNIDNPMKMAPQGINFQGQGPAPPPPGYGYPPQQDQWGTDMGSGAAFDMQPEMGMADMNAGMGGAGGDKTEELVEAIIDEKWNELMKHINKISEWKEKTEQRITDMEQSMKDLKDNFDRLHQAIIGKISEYDQNILNVGTEIKAMEKVFQKLLPTFTENINELSRYTEKLKNVDRPVLGQKVAGKKSIEDNM